MQTFACRLNLIALALGVALTAPGCATDWFSSSSSDYVAGELSQDVESLPDPNAPPTPPKRPSIVSPLGAPFKESPDRLLLQANAYFEQGKFHDSARLYQKYLATPEAAAAPPTVLGQAHHRIAVVARKKMNFAEAKREFEIALGHEPQNQQYRFDLGKSAFDGADYATADAAFSALIAQNPNYPQAQYYYGLTLLEGTRRAEAIAPLTKAVGELEAAALLADKYYAIGETENAATWEAQTTQIAARLGRPVPAFPNKPASAPTAQPQNVAQIAQAAQPTQTQTIVQAAQPTQTQTVAQGPQPAQTQTVAQAAQPTQMVAQDVQPAQTQTVAQAAQPPQTVAQAAQPPQTVAQAAQPPQTVAQGPQPAQTVAQGPQPAPTVAQGPQPAQTVAQAAQPAQTQTVAQDVQPTPQVAANAQLQGPAPFVATVAPQTDEEKSVSSVEPPVVANAATLENAKSADVQPQPLAAATPETPISSETVQPSISETLLSQTAETDALPTASADQETETAQALTTHIGRGNPGLLATSPFAEVAPPAETNFRPGSISTTTEPVAQNVPVEQATQDAQIAQNVPVEKATQDAQIAQNVPVEKATQDAQIAQNVPVKQATQDAQIAQNVPVEKATQDATTVGPTFPQPLTFDLEAAFRRVEQLFELENCVAEFFAPLAPIYETAPSPFQIADAEELYAAAPSPSEFAVDEEEEFDENDDFAFASSGTPQPIQTATPAPPVGGFGSYQAPTVDPTPVAAPVPVPSQAQPFAQNAQTALTPQLSQLPQLPQSAPAPQTTHIPQYVQTPATAAIPQSAPAPQTTYISQYAQTTLPPAAPQYPQVAQPLQFPQSAATPVSQYAAPNAVSRRPATPEERLQAAIAAGAEVREISPEEYRRAVQVGLAGQAQPR